MQSNPNRIPSSMFGLSKYFQSKLYMLPYGHKHQYRTSKNKTLRTWRIGK